MAQLITDIGEMRKTSGRLRAEGKKVGVVPTMGALHEGHLTLVRTARQHADAVITTVFVNPTQFGRGEDFDRYPRDLSKDVALASSAGTDYVFAPSSSDMYPGGCTTSVEVGGVSEVLEGAVRPGHFRGVATVVLKLMNITMPHVAVFGQKDAQQVVVIRHLLRDVNLDIALVIVPIVREPDGLAMSSRNAYLSAAERVQAPVLYRSLEQARTLITGGERSAERIVGAMGTLIRSSSTGVIDYISIADAETLEEQAQCIPGRQLLISLAVRFGATRLIDNIQITPS